MILGGSPASTSAPTLPPLNVIPVERVHTLSQRAADYLLVLVAAHLMEHQTLTCERFLTLADEAEAIAS